MANFAYDIGDQVGEFEVISRSENTENGELQYTIVSKADAEKRHEIEERERANREAAEAQSQLDLETEAAINTAPPTPAEDAAQAAASEVPETLQPKS